MRVQVLKWAVPLIAAAVVLPVPRALGQTLEALGPLPGYQFSHAFGINASGAVTGYVWGPVDYYSGTAVIWDGVVPTALAGLPGGKGSAAYDINDSGVVAGFARDDAGVFYAATWTGGIPTALELPVGSVQAFGWAINNSGLVVGMAKTTTADTYTDSQAYVWNGTVASALPNLPGGTASVAWGVNDLGQVTGMCSVSGQWHAVVWDGGVPIDLGIGSGLGANDAGRVAGGTGTATYWDLSDPTHPHLIPGTTNGTARGINQIGTIAGETEVAGVMRAFVWDGTGLTLIDPLPGDYQNIADGINDKGQVCGNSSSLGGTCAYRWTPAMPEAIGVAPLLYALLPLAGVLRRRR